MRGVLRLSPSSEDASPASIGGENESNLGMWTGEKRGEDESNWGMWTGERRGDAEREIGRIAGTDEKRVARTGRRWHRNTRRDGGGTRREREHGRALFIRTKEPMFGNGRSNGRPNCSWPQKRGGPRRKHGRSPFFHTRLASACALSTYRSKPHKIRISYTHATTSEGRQRDLPNARRFSCRSPRYFAMSMSLHDSRGQSATLRHVCLRLTDKADAREHAPTLRELDKGSWESDKEWVRT